MSEWLWKRELTGRFDGNEEKEDVIEGLLGRRGADDAQAGANCYHSYAMAVGLNKPFAAFLGVVNSSRALEGAGANLTEGQAVFLDAFIGHGGVEAAVAFLVQQCVPAGLFSFEPIMAGIVDEDEFVVLNYLLQNDLGFAASIRSYIYFLDDEMPRVYSAPGLAHFNDIEYCCRLFILEKTFDLLDFALAVRPDMASVLCRTPGLGDMLKACLLCKYTFFFTATFLNNLTIDACMTMVDFNFLYDVLEQIPPIQFAILIRRLLFVNELNDTASGANDAGWNTLRFRPARLDYFSSIRSTLFSWLERPNLVAKLVKILRFLPCTYTEGVHLMIENITMSRDVFRTSRGVSAFYQWESLPQPRDSNLSPEHDDLIETLIIIAHTSEIFYLLHFLMSSKNKAPVKTILKACGFTDVASSLFDKFEWQTLTLAERDFGREGVGSASPIDAKANFLRTLSSYMGKDLDNAEALLPTEEMTIKRGIPQRNFHRLPPPPEGYGLLSKVIRACLYQEDYSPYFSWLCPCIESFLRHCDDENTRWWVANGGLLEFLVKTMARCPNLKKERRQILSDTIAETIRFSPRGLALLETTFAAEPSVAEYFFRAFETSIIDMNILVRNILAVDHVYGDMADKHWPTIHRFFRDHKLSILRDCISSISDQSVNSECICVLNTFIFAFYLAEDRRALFDELYESSKESPIDWHKCLKLLVFWPAFYLFHVDDVKYIEAIIRAPFDEFHAVQKLLYSWVLDIPTDC